MSALLLVVLLSVAVQGWSPPWFCHELDCPEFELEKQVDYKEQVIEIRRYEAKLMWTSTVVETTSLTQADKVGFDKLFRYISGDNKGSVKVPMASPVREYVQPGKGPACASNFTVSFFVPYEYQTGVNATAVSPPKPAEADVMTTEDRTALRVAVLGFSGQAPEDTVLEKAAELYSFLQTTNMSYDASNWFFSAYDPPFRLVSRHQEVWVQLFA